MYGLAINLWYTGTFKRWDTTVRIPQACLLISLKGVSEHLGRLNSGIWTWPCGFVATWRYKLPSIYKWVMCSETQLYMRKCYIKFYLYYLKLEKCSWVCKNHKNTNKNLYNKKKDYYELKAEASLVMGCSTCNRYPFALHYPHLSYCMLLYCALDNLILLYVAVLTYWSMI